MKILWVGPLHSNHAVAVRRATNQAAAKWSRGLLRGFLDVGVDVVSLSHCYEQLWPKGELWPGSEADFDSLIPYKQVIYPNLHGLKNFYLNWAYGAYTKELLKQNKVDAVVCYNIFRMPCHVASIEMAYKLGVPSFPIILDGEDPRKDQWRAILKATRYAKGIVFLSKWMIDNYPGEADVFHMDGGCEEWFGDDASKLIDPNLIVYTGALDHWRGLDFLIEVVQRLANPNYKIVICGKCDRTAIQKLFGDDKRVSVKGFVSNEELHDICCRAAAFLNTRDPKIAENILNFPSKVPNYLAYGKPIISTWIDSFSEDYHDYLQIVNEDSVEAFVVRINNVMAWSQADRERFCQHVRGWFCQNKLWSRQAKRLSDWIATRIR